MQCVIFDVNNKRFCIDISNVDSIHEFMKLTDVPNAPEYIRGLTNLRGTVIAVVDLHKIFRYPFDKITDATRIINIRFQDGIIGLLVDSVYQVLTIKDECLVDIPSILQKENQKYLKKIAIIDKELVIVVDTDFILNDNEKECIKNIVESVKDTSTQE